MVRSPWEEMRRLSHEIDRTFNQLFSEARTELPVLSRERIPLMDIYETPEEVVVIADMPGINKENIEVKITEKNITINAETKKEEEIEEEGYYIRERGKLDLYRRLPLPKQVKADQAKATYSNGTLKITLPKLETEKKKEAVSIKVE